MSTIQFSNRELAEFVAGWVMSKACDFKTAMRVIGFAGHCNAEAYSVRYSEPIDVTADIDEIESEALRILADKSSPVGRVRVSGLAYNCAESAGFQIVTDCGKSICEIVQAIEDKARGWLESIEREAKRKQENDEAYSDEAPLPKITGAELKKRATGFARVIVADFGVDESDCYTDYHGGRSVRRVVIGFGKSKREDFRQLRSAAAQFPPTGYIAADRVFVVLVEDTANHGGRYERWKDEQYKTRYFPTVDDAKNAVETMQKTHPQCQPGYVGCIDWEGRTKREGARIEFEVESPEHRENYSMGGGNYLGWSRHGGWTVYSLPVDFLGDNSEIEFFEAPTKIVNGRKIAPAAPPRSQKPKPDAVPFPKWTGKGLLQKTPGNYDWPHCYRSEETAGRDVSKLAELGIVAEVKQGRRRACFFVKRVDSEGGAQ